MSEALGLIKQIKTRQKAEEVLQGLGVSSIAGREFEELLAGAKQVSVTLAFYPRESLLSKISDWFTRNLGEKTIIDLIVDPGIVGGLKVLCNDHFRDYSVRGQLEQMGLIDGLPEEEENAGAVI